MKRHYYFLCLIFIIVSFACKSISLNNPSIQTPNYATPSNEASNSNSLDINPAIEWLTFSGKGNPFVYDIKRDNKGNIYTLEESHDDEKGNCDLWVTKVTDKGATEWQILVTKVNDLSHTSLVLDGEGNVYVSGISTESWGNPINPFTPRGYYPWDVFVAKIDGQRGLLLWNTFLGNNRSSTMVFANNTIYILTLGGHDEDPVLVKLNSNGEILQNKSLAAGASTHARAYSDLEIDSNGNLYAAGEIFNGNDTDNFISKYSNDGTLLWETIIGGSGDQDEHFIDQLQIEVDDNGNIFLHGYSNASWGTPLNAYDGGYILSPDDYDNGFEDFIAKYDNNGVALWYTFLNKEIYVFDILLDDNGNLFIVGSSSNTWGNPFTPFNNFSGKSDGFIAQMNTDGTLLWNTFVSGEGGGIRGITLGDDQHIYISGTSNASFGNPINPINLNVDSKYGAFDVFIASIKLYK